VAVFDRLVRPTLDEDERRRNRNGPAELVTAAHIGRLRPHEWKPLPPTCSVPGTAKPVAGAPDGGGGGGGVVRVAYSPPELPPNAPPRLRGEDAPDDALPDARDYDRVPAKPRLPVDAGGVGRALAHIDALARRRDSSSAPRVLTRPAEVRKCGTVPCKFFAAGACGRGAECTFKHDAPQNAPRAAAPRAAADAPPPPPASPPVKPTTLLRRPRDPATALDSDARPFEPAPAPRAPSPRAPANRGRAKGGNHHKGNKSKGRGGSDKPKPPRAIASSPRVAAPKAAAAPPPPPKVAPPKAAAPPQAAAAAAAT